MNHASLRNLGSVDIKNTKVGFPGSFGGRLKIWASLPEVAPLAAFRAMSTEPNVGLYMDFY